jgi:hypothetical protein
VKNILRFFNFQYLWLFFPFIILTLFVIQGIVGFLIYRDFSSIQFLLILILGISTYFISHFVITKHLNKSFGFFKATGKYQLTLDFWVILISLIYFSIVIYALISSEKIALLESFKGATNFDMAIAREGLFKSRSGWEMSLKYFNSVLSTAFMPLILVIAYLKNKSYKHLLLLLFLLSTLPSLEKSLAIKVFAPLIILSLNRFLTRRAGWVFFAVMLLVIFGTTVLSGVGSDDAQQTKTETVAQQTKTEKHTRTFHEIKYSPITVGGKVGYMANRILWIPYITAYDWLKFFNEKLNGQYLLGRTSLIISKITGQTQYPMEQEIFKYQFGGSSKLLTASANTTFFVDIFVNFSWLGVVIFSCLLALITRLVEVSNNPAGMAVFYYYVFQVSIGGILAVLLSGGLLFFIFLIFILKPDTIESNFQK